MFCIITFPVIVYFCMKVISQPEARTCYIMAVVLIIYIILARAVILGFKNVLCYKINGEVYIIDSDMVFNQNNNIEAPQPARANSEFPDMDLPPSYAECMISSPPNKLKITDSAPPPYYV